MMDTMTLNSGEKDMVEFLSKGRFDRARARNAHFRKMGTGRDNYFADRIGMYAELAFAKMTNNYPEQVLSPICNTKESGNDLGDVIFDDKKFDVKSTHHEHGVLWIDKVNKSVDYYVFYVVKELDDTVQADCKGVILAEDLHSKPMVHRKQFKFPCMFADQNELIPWIDFIKRIQN